MPNSFEKFSDPSRKVVIQGEPEKKAPKPKMTKDVLYRIIGMVLAFVIYLIVLSGVYENLITQVKRNQLNELSDQRAELTAQNIQTYVSSIKPKLEFYTRKPRLISAFAAGDSAVLKEFSDLISAQVEDVSSVRFIAKGSAAVDQNAVPPIRFAELDMIKRAEQREEVKPEAAKVGNDWHLNYVVPVPFDGNQASIGTLLVSFSMEGLKKQLLQNNARVGRVKLLQKFGSGKPLTVISIGSGDLLEPKTRAVAGSYFIVSFEPSDGLAAQTHANYILVVIIALVCLFLFLWLGRYGVWKLAVIVESLVSKRGKEAVRVSVGGDDAITHMDHLYQSKNILGVEITEGDEDLLGLGDDQEEKKEEPSPAEEQAEEPIFSSDIPDEVFRAYDIRGLAKTQITNEFARKVGQAVACEALDAGENTLIVGRDARTSSPELTEFLIRGILSTGCNVLNIGTVPTPLMYFATEVLETGRSGVMVTASHNPADHNGFKVVIDGKCRSEEDIKAIRRRIIEERLYQGAGQEHRHDIIPDYIDTIFSDVALAGDISIVVDAANAVPGTVAPRLFEELGCQVTPIFCDLDGTFPNHEPDTSKPENLKPLIAKVKEIGADLGVAFDGDGDRIAVVTPKGKIIWPDRLLMLFARDIVSRNPGADVVFDVKSTRHLSACISEVGGRPIMWKTGHSPMKSKMQETGALLGGEYSGHIFIKDRWYGFDDGLYAAARLIEIISLQGSDLDTLFEEFPESLNTPEIRVDVDESKKFKIVETLLKTGDFLNAKITSIDGLRADFPDGWGLIRASNTGPELTLRFEADNKETMHKIKALFVRELRKIDNTINIDWKQK